MLDRRGASHLERPLEVEAQAVAGERAVIAERLQFGEQQASVIAVHLDQFAALWHPRAEKHGLAIRQQR